jgi:hypothetical protein
MHWVADPVDHDRNIADLIGAQGTGGHHAILYTSRDVQPIGTTRVFENEDQAMIQFVGGVGGEGGDQLELPEGVVLRVPAGRALVLQTHYLNTSDAPLEGSSRVDVKFGEPADTDRVAHFFSHGSRRVSVPPHQDSELEISCVTQRDLPLIMYANHMHEMGTSIVTSVTTEGATESLKIDATWATEWTFNPDYTVGDVGAPRVVKAGSTLTTRCEWRNTGDELLAPPDEMCVFFGFFLGDRDMSCVDGVWRE